MIDMTAYLQDNPYPGRGIMTGRSADNKCAVIAYFMTTYGVLLII